MKSQPFAKARTALRVVGGTLAGLLATEVAIRIFVTTGSTPVPNIQADSLDADVIEWRQLEEGVATSHFSIHGGRMTGNPPAGSGSVAIIMGDSYVLALQVGDRQTMGSRLEARARSNGMPLDVRQYGWSGASPAQYLYVAPQVRQRWAGAHVFIILSANDFDRNALQLANPRFRVDSTNRLRIVGDPVPIVPPLPPSTSAMFWLARHRWSTISGRVARRSAAKRGDKVTAWTVPAAAPSETPPDSLEYERAPAAVIRALSEAYGPSLTVVYLAELRLNNPSDSERAETLMLEACARTGTDCFSTRSGMASALRDGHVARGLGIIPLGNGHLNPEGHGIVADLLWARLSRGALAERAP